MGFLKARKLLLILLKAKEDLSLFIEAAEVSRKELKILEETSSVDINKYVELYNSKLKGKK